MSAYKDGKQWRYRKRIELPDGRRTRIKGTPKTNTKAAAEAAEARHIFRKLHPTAAAASTPTRKEVPTLKEYRKTFLAHYAAGKPNDLDSKAQHLNAYIEPRFGGFPLDAIVQSEVDAFVVELLDGRSRKTVNNVLATLSSLLGHAVKSRVIPDPDLRMWIENEDTELVALSDEDVEALLAVADGRYRAAILLGCQSGLRIGEIRGLRWGDLNELRRELGIARAIDLKNRVTAPKHWRSRTIPAPERLWSALRALPQGTETVITRRDLKPISYWGLRDGIHTVYRKAGLTAPPLPWHCLRHTYGTRLAEAGVPLHVIKELMGHRSITTTLRYCHPNQAAKSAAIASAFGPVVGPKASGANEKPPKP